ncbi:tripartite tricarboxylate transporter TctB family protein [Antarctobacter heliothermus]|uniref:Tripartite tricarboxylate transporter TctB family protein n=1 Tax=Antarctobacter heliothermus TaxID=74033 RepID=A0A222E4X4_9RHOB|nr:tripartite tricarboxylate transporter TctB family protein [Antarctobacter heliothermus]ASP21247.1 tripartite tricarboxylate transporter TctB family protein [Antarctobacter heliothermus]
MPTLNLVASIATSALLVGLSLFLAGPAFDLPGLGPKGGLRAGTLPQFVVVVVIALAVLSVINDVVKWRADRRPGHMPEQPFAPVRQVVAVGGSVLVLLAAYVFAWGPLPFPLISFVFFTAVGAILSPPTERTLRGYSKIALTGLLFSTGVWLIFTFVLNVPLR